MKLDEIVRKTVESTYGALGKLLKHHHFDYNLSVEIEVGDYSREFSDSNRTEIEFILMEYVLNARKAIYGTDEFPYRAPNAEELKSIPARITVKLNEEDKVYVLSVTDNGDGIPVENRDKIFRDQFSTRGTTGIGLRMVCNTALLKLKGYVDFDSEVGKGSTFRLYLPKK
ncbi:MAG: sensor histidine kinase [Nanoarchaeota archaeon]